MEAKVNKVISGMAKDSWSTESNQYTHAVNSNIEGDEGKRYVLGNEASNILSTKIKEGYKVIGRGREYSTDHLYLVLTNPTTKNSEIGYIRLKPFVDSEILGADECKDCGSLSIGDRLEDIEQEPYLEYVTVISDDCHTDSNKKFGFNVNYPIKNIVFKKEGTVVKMYITDGYTNPIMIEVSNTKKYYTQQIPCGDDVIVDCPDIEMMKIFKDSRPPYIEIKGVERGGTLPESRYQYFGKYCDKEGNEATEVLVYSTSIDLFNSGQVTRELNTTIDTNLAIKLRFRGLDKRYTNFKVFVRIAFPANVENGGYIFRTFELGVYPIDRQEIIHYTNNQLKEVDELTSLYTGRRYVKTTDILSTSNNVLIHSGVREQEVINLQPVVNLLGQFIRWRTFQTKEDFYANPKSSTFVGYARDEIVPLSIKFITETGYKTANFPLISRLPEEADLKPVNKGNDFKSIDKGASNCSSTSRDVHWQFYNTATQVVGDVCIDDEEEDIEYVEVEEVLERTCTTDEISSLTDGMISISIEDEYYDLPTYIGEIYEGGVSACNLNVSGPSGRELCRLLFEDYPVSPTCNTDELFMGLEYRILRTTKTNGIGEVEGSEETKIQADFPNEYTLASAPTKQTPLQKGINPEDRDSEIIPIIAQLGLLHLAIFDTGRDPKNRWRMMPEVYVRNTEDQSVACYGSEEAVRLTDVSSDIRKVTNNKFRSFIYSLDGERTEEQLLKEMWSNKRHKLPEVVHTANDDVIVLGIGNTIEREENGADTRNKYRDTILDARAGGRITGAGGSYESGMGATPSSYAGRMTRNFNQNMLRTVLRPLGVTSYRNYEDEHTAYGKYKGPIPTHFEMEFIGDGESNFGFYGVNDFRPTRVSNNASWTKVVPVVTADEPDFVIDVSPSGNTYYNAREDFFNRVYNQGGLGSRVVLSIFLDCNQEEATYSIETTYNKAHSFKFVRVNSNDLTIIDSNGDSITIEGGYRASGYYICIDTLTIKLPRLNNKVGGYIMFPSMGYYSVSWRPVVYKRVDIKFKKISITQEAIFEGLCKFRQPVLNSCSVIPQKLGKFAYWESTREYPDNPITFDSSKLMIDKKKIPPRISSEFLSKFSKGEKDNKVLLNDNADFRCKKIRHFKFPDNNVAPFISTIPLQPFAESLIEILGISIDEEVIEFLLDTAVDNELITKEFRKTIIGYEILRGDLTVERSVKSSGLLYDTRVYQENSNSIRYPNYPYNSFERDIFNNTDNRPDGFGTRGSMFTYHSPETDFSKDSQGTELSVQGVQYGYSKGRFEEVRDHPKWVIMSSRAFKSATKLADNEIAYDLLISSSLALSAGTTGFFAGMSSGTILPINAIIASAAILGAVMTADPVKQKYKLEWLRTYENLGVPVNYAHYYHSVGKYSYLDKEVKADSKVRGVNLNKFVGSGSFNVNNPITGKRTLFNNRYREESVIIDVGDYSIEYPETYKSYDVGANSSMYRLDKGSYSGDKNQSVESTRNIASMYVLMKDYLPEQHGSLNSIEWVFTGFVGDLKVPNNCTKIFGGDTYIVRHSLKRKHSQFDVDYHKQADMTPIDYKHYNNIGSDPKYYVKFKTDTEGGDNTEYSYTLALDNETSSGRYYTPPSKFYLYYYGIPYFLCESRINTNFRVAGKEWREQFYPEASDISQWTQQSVVGIQEPNTFFYNHGLYNSRPITLGSSMLPEQFDPSDDKNQAYKQGMILYSDPDNDIFGTIDPWSIYKPNNVYFSNTDWGRLQGVVGIENEAMLGIYDLRSVLFNSVDTTIDTGSSPIQREFGNGKLFSRRIRDFSTSVGGYGGSQGYHSISTEFGHFYVNNEAGEVYQLVGTELYPVSSVNRDGKPTFMERWFKIHLPFKILRSNIENISSLDVDNAFNGIGMTLGYDNKYKRLFITKKDYLPLVDGIEYRHKDGFYLEDQLIALDDTRYFKDIGFTIAFSVKGGSWISFYDFKPNYYVTDRSTFYTGVNKEGEEKGMWVHGVTNKSYQVFYGKKYPWVVEFNVDRTVGMLNSVGEINFDLTVNKYHNNYDKVIIDGMFDKIYVYGEEENSGELRPIISNGSLWEVAQYPKTSLDKSYQEVLATKVSDSTYSMNYIYDRTNHKVSGVPNWINSPDGYNKELNYRKVNFYPHNEVLAPLRVKVPTIRLEQINETRLSYNLDLVISKSTLRKD